MSSLRKVKATSFEFGRIYWMDGTGVCACGAEIKYNWLPVLYSGETEDALGMTAHFFEPMMYLFCKSCRNYVEGINQYDLSIDDVPLFKKQEI